MNASEDQIKTLPNPTEMESVMKDILEAALSRLTVGIVLAFYIRLCQNLNNYVPFAFVLLHFIWAAPLVKCASS